MLGSKRPPRVCEGWAPSLAGAARPRSAVAAHEKPVDRRHRSGMLSLRQNISPQVPSNDRDVADTMASRIPRGRHPEHAFDGSTVRRGIRDRMRIFGSELSYQGFQPADGFISGRVAQHAIGSFGLGRPENLAMFGQMATRWAPVDLIRPLVGRNLTATKSQSY